MHIIMTTVIEIVTPKRLSAFLNQVTTSTGLPPEGVEKFCNGEVVAVRQEHSDGTVSTTSLLLGEADHPSDIPEGPCR